MKNNKLLLLLMTIGLTSCSSVPSSSSSSSSISSSSSSCSSVVSSINTSSSSTSTSSSSVSSISSSSSSSSSTSSSSSSPIIAEKGEFAYEDDEYVAKKFNSLYILENQILEGTRIIGLKIGSTVADNGILINYEKVDDKESYYFIGFDFSGNFVIRKTENGSTSVVENFDFKKDFTKVINLGLVRKDNKLSLYIDNEYIYSMDLEFLSNSLGLFAGGKNTSYKIADLVSGYNKYLNELDSYSVTSGTFNNDERIISSESNSIAVNNHQEFSNGTLEAKVKQTGKLSDNGIIFSLEDNGKENFWEAGVSYYFYFVSLDGLAYLGKVKNSSWYLCSTKSIPDYDAFGTYSLKIIKKNNIIYCFVDGELYFSYTDSSPLKGTKFGVRAGTKDVEFSYINVSNREVEAKASTNIEIGHGGFEDFEGILNTTGKKNIAIKKNENLKLGTIETTLIPGSSNNSGIIFRASTPEGEYYSSENNLSYYWLYYTSSGTIGFSRFENGVEEKLSAKFLPYGSLANKSYKVKIVMDENDFYCYFDGRLSFHYHDDNPLVGEKFGVKAEAENCLVADFVTSDTHEKETYEYLIFGHSYTEYWSTYKDDLPYFEDIKDIGIGASTTSHWYNQYTNEVIAYEPRYGIYWNGINDISQNVAPSLIASNIENMLVAIKDEVPEFEVVLLGTNRCPFAKSNRDKIHQLNVLLESIGKKYDYIHYVDTEYLYCDSSGNELSKYFTDGLHPNHEGYLLVASLIEATLGL